MKLIQLEVLDDLGLTCPYCGDTYGSRLGCCGESTAHGEQSYLVRMSDGSEEVILESELNIQLNELP